MVVQLSHMRARALAVLSPMLDPPQLLVILPRLEMLYCYRYHALWFVYARTTAAAATRSNENK